MANDRPMNIQDVFLNHVRRNKVPLTIFLMNGVKLQGIMSWFDAHTMMLRRDGQMQLVYKHAISTIMPQIPVHLFEQSNESIVDSSEQIDDLAIEEGISF